MHLFARPSDTGKSFKEETLERIMFTFNKRLAFKVVVILLQTLKICIIIYSFYNIFKCVCIINSFVGNYHVAILPTRREMEKKQKFRMLLLKLIVYNK